MDINKKSIQFPMNLFCSLMLLSFIPFLYTLVRTNLIANSPSTDRLGIAGHIEWFALKELQIPSDVILKQIFRYKRY